MSMRGTFWNHELEIAGCLAFALSTTVAGVSQQAAPVAPAAPAFQSTDRLDEPWWAARHNAILEALKAHPQVDLLFVGDSITQNYEKRQPPDENFEPTWQYYYADRRPMNLGFSGDTTGNVLWRLQHGEVEGLHPRVVVLLIGVNDTDYRKYPAEEAESGIDADIAELKARLPQAKILLLAILPSHRSDTVTAANLAINKYTAAKYSHDPAVTYLDIGNVFMVDGKLNEARFYDPRLPRPGGALHPDTGGQRMMAAAIEPTLAKLLGDAPKK